MRNSNYQLASKPRLSRSSIFFTFASLGMCIKQSVYCSIPFLLCILTLLTTQNASTYQMPPPPFEKINVMQQRKTPHIRVLIAQYPLKKNKPVTISAPHGIMVYAGKDFAPLSCHASAKLHTTHHGFIVEQGGKKTTVRHHELTLTPLKNAPFTLNETPYHGKLTLLHDTENKNVLFINTIDLEEYVYAVLPYESFQSWPHEMHTIQAITTRTYAFYLMRKNQRKKAYDICSTNVHQRYCGTHSFEHIKKAVDATRGMVLTYQGDVANAMFDACCGGIIPAHIVHHDYTQAPYLAREQACTFCASSKLFTWHKQIPLNNFLERLTIKSHRYESINKTLKKAGPIQAIQIAEKDKAGIVRKFNLKGRYKSINIEEPLLHNTLRGLFTSLSFNLAQKGAMLIAQGKGFGHQIGLCQYGARELVRRGWNIEKILRFYFPKTDLSLLG